MRSVRLWSYLASIVALSVSSVVIGLAVAAAGHGVTQSVLAGGLILFAGLVWVTISETYEEIRLARRRSRPRRRRPHPVSEPSEISLAEFVPPELFTDEHSKAA